MIIKICGMREADNIREIEEIGPDLMGFIFWEGTKRNVSSIPDYMPSRCKRVGVFVDADEEFISTHVKEYKLNFIQLHGHETPEFCERLHQVLPDIKIIKAISVKDTDDIRNANVYNGVADYFLFDTKCKCVGGSGEQFDWDILKNYENDIPFLLSGGIGPKDVERVKAFKHPMMIGIDLNSKFELSPAMKDVVTLKEFINNIR
jgi:phosphoribosylanthranilate isomerase